MPNLIPLEQFVCDKCHQTIENASEGYVVWHADDDGRPYDFKIIHQGLCDDNSPKSAALEEFLGPRGLIMLTAFLSPGQIVINTQSQTDDDLPKSLDEFVDFIRRVQVPYYEEARQKFNQFEFLEEYGHDHGLSPYFEEKLKHICDTDFT